MSDKSKLWGGAFSEDPDDIAWRFGQSVGDDVVFWREEIEVCIAHTEMLDKTCIVEAAICHRILNELNALLASGDWVAQHLNSEDIHSAVEAELEKRIGDDAKFMTAARSRNDQVATVSRLWVARGAENCQEEIVALQQTLIGLGRKHAEDPLLGTTHMQAAQPITLGYHLMAYFWMLQRDKEKYDTIAKNAMEYCPLGSCAIAGTSLPIDREFTSKKLGFDQPSPSAIDSVSDRDFIGEMLHAMALCMQHLSRISQELALWATPQFGYVRIADAYSTGSSLMPQKRNPDMAELVRGRAAKAIGAYTSFMSMMQGLPLSYNRDMQDDKSGMFEVYSTTLASLELTNGMLQTATFNTEKMAVDANFPGGTATDSADRLVAEGMSFRQAHEEIGRQVRKGSLTPIDAQESIKSRNSYGGVGDFQTQLAAAEALLTRSS